jgi:hypothetical protein
MKRSVSEEEFLFLNYPVPRDVAVYIGHYCSVTMLHNMRHVSKSMHRMVHLIGRGRDFFPCYEVALMTYDEVLVILKDDVSDEIPLNKISPLRMQDNSKSHVLSNSIFTLFPDYHPLYSHVIPILHHGSIMTDSKTFDCRCIGLFGNDYTLTGFFQKSDLPSSFGKVTEIGFILNKSKNCIYLYMIWNNVQ